MHDKSGPLVSLTGKTFPVRFDLRALGATWDRSARAWRIAADKAAAAQALIDNQSGEAWVCDECGAELDRPWCKDCRDEMFIRQVKF